MRTKWLEMHYKNKDNKKGSEKATLILFVCLENFICNCNKVIRTAGINKVSCY